MSKDTTIVGRHARYKAGQQIVMTWLVNAAARHCDLAGHLGSLAGSRVDKCHDIRTVARHEILGLGEIVANGNPPTIVPQHVYKILEDVIAGREAANVWYSSQPRNTDHDGHLFFINTLRRLRDMLGSFRSGCEPTQKRDAPRSKRAARKAPKEDDDTPANIFSRLNLHEPAEEPLGHLPLPSQAESRGPPSFTVDDEKDQDIFALWCFLEDMNDIRQMVRELWSEVRDGQVTLATAGLVTEMAFGLIHRAYRDFIAITPQFPHWQSIVQFLELKIYINNNVVYQMPKTYHHAATPSSAQAKAADLLCTSAYLILRAFTGATEQCLESATDRNGARNGIIGAKIGVLHHERPRSKFEAVLLSMVPEFTSLKGYSLIDRHDPSFGSEFYPEDSNEHIFARQKKTEFIEGLLEITVGSPHRGDAPMWVTIICAIAMDIQDQVGSLPNMGGDAVLESANDIIKAIDDAKEFFTTPSTKRSFSPAQRASWSDVKDLATGYSAFISTARSLADPKAISVMSVDEHIDLHKQKSFHPTLNSLPHEAGDVQCILKTEMHATGVWLANEHCALLVLAHFYNAARRYGLISATWHDMDFVTAQHSTKKSFVTKTHPSADAHAPVRHLLLDLGIELKPLAGGKPMSPPTVRVVQAKSKKLHPADSKLRTAMSARAEAGRKLLGTARYDFYTVVLIAMSEAADASSGPGARHQQRHFAPQDLLETLKREFIADEPGLNFNYLGFTTFCVDICVQLMNIDISKLLKRGSKSVNTVYGFIYYLMKNAADVKASGGYVAATPFGKAAAIMQAALAEGNNAKKFSQAALNKSSGRVPKASRPKFEPHDPQTDVAIDQLRSMLPDASIGSLRQTIEIYDPKGGSMKGSDLLIRSNTMAQLMHGPRSLVTYAVVSPSDRDELRDEVSGTSSMVVLDDVQDSLVCSELASYHFGKAA